ncbi:MAG: toll/interleukin-1 receptor domain-containing protein [Rhodoferax sp.]|nr:toll/interleukin-1 receptor domain-containing protein [Rhodoferax sp.]
MTSIFISYRRSDSAAHAGRIAATLRGHAASPQVFFDTTDIAPGNIWPHSLEKALATCDVMLVVIGPQWLAPAPGAAYSRLHDLNDIVSREISCCAAAGSDCWRFGTGCGPMRSTRTASSPTPGCAARCSSMRRTHRVHAPPCRFCGMRC